MRKNMTARDDMIAGLEGKLGKPLNYFPIDSQKTFKNDKEEDRAYFVKGYKGYADLKKYAAALAKNGEDLDARQDLSGLLVGDPNFHVNVPGLRMREIADAFSGVSDEEFGRYAERNRDEFFGILEGDKKALMDLAQNLPLYASEDEADKEYNTIVGISRSMREMAGIAQAGEDGQRDPGKIREYMVNGLQSKKISKAAKKLMEFLYGFDEVAGYFFSREFGLKKKLFATKLAGEDGKTPDNKLIRKTIEKSLEVANGKLDDETDAKNKNKIWERAIRPYYLSMADATYKIKKKELDDDNDDKVEEKEREAERLKLGMPKI